MALQCSSSSSSRYAIDVQNEIAAEMQIMGECGRKENFASKPRDKRRRKTGVFCGHREKLNHLLGLSGTRNSCALGVPPVQAPKRSFSRSRKRHATKVVNVYLGQVMESFFYAKCVEQKKSTPDIDSREFASLLSQSFTASVVQEDDQYDFLNCEMRRNENGKLTPYGEIPRSGGKKGFLPCQLAHTLVYLFKRGFFVKRLGTGKKKKNN